MTAGSRLWPPLATTILGIELCKTFQFQRKRGDMFEMGPAVRGSLGLLISAFVALVLAGCHGGGARSPQGTVATAPAALSAAPIRIKAGVDAPFKDNKGNIWMPDTGLFADGDVATRDDSLAIANTTDPAMFRSERYGMTSFSYNLPNGKYKVKLYFADTYEGITGPGQRVFSFNVQGHEVKDFDIVAKVGPNRADIETFDVDVTGGKLRINFTPNVENPEINAIEIIPQ
jgi:hypothetical protein